MSAVGVREPDGGLPRWPFAFVLVFAVVGVGAILISESLIGRPFYDDEGYMLVSLRGVIDGHALYDDVYSQYGPAYFSLVGGLMALFRVPLTMDAARIATALMWLVTSGLLGVSVTSVTRRKEAGLLVFVITAACSAVAAEAALHPTHLVCLFTALAAFGITQIERSRMPRVSAAMVGVAVAGTLLSKINVGVFLAAAVVYAVAAPRQRVLGLARSAVVVAVPVALAILGSVSGNNGELAWGLALAAAVFVAGARSDGSVRRAGLRLPVVFAAATGIVVLLWAMLTGTSLNDLAQGVIVQPLGLADAFSVPSSVSTTTLGLALLFGLVAIASRRTTGEWAAVATSGFGALVVLLAAYLITRTSDFRGLNALVLGATVAWVATRAAEPSASRLVIASLGVLFPLQAVPVAGGQRIAGALLFPAIGVIAAVDALDRLPRSLPSLGPDALKRAAPYGLVACAAVAMLAAARETRVDRDAAEKLDLRGARLVRTTAADADDVRAVAAVLKGCPTFYSLPGLNSFYVYADKRPPTWQNATTWMALFDRDQQQQVVDALTRLGGFCLLRSDKVERFWLDGGTEQEGPLRPYLEANVELVAEHGDYTIYRHD